MNCRIPDLTGEPARLVAIGLAAARALIGVGALVRPGLPAAAWVGRKDASRPAVQLFARTLGGRDLALGLGALLALRKGAPARGWIEAGALADVGDTAATLLAFSALPRRGRFGILASTASAALLGAWSARRLDEGRATAPID